MNVKLKVGLCGDPDKLVVELLQEQLDELVLWIEAQTPKTIQYYFGLLPCHLVFCQIMLDKFLHSLQKRKIQFGASQSIVKLKLREQVQEVDNGLQVGMVKGLHDVVLECKQHRLFQVSHFMKVHQNLREFLALYLVEFL